MSNELHAFAPLAKTLYAILFNSTGAVWNGAEFETIDGRHIDLYAIPLTGALELGIYLADMPAVAQGVYSYAVYEQAGETVQTSDALWAVGSIAWSGTAKIVPSSNIAGSGTGSYTDTIVDGAAPLDGVRVQLSTDAEGLNRVYEAITNASGVFAMNPDPGTYYRWLDLAGYTFSQGVEVEVE